MTNNLSWMFYGVMWLEMHCTYWMLKAFLKSWRVLEEKGEKSTHFAGELNLHFLHCFWRSLFAVSVAMVTGVSVEDRFPYLTKVGTLPVLWGWHRLNLSVNVWMLYFYLACVFAFTSWLNTLWSPTSSCYVSFWDAEWPKFESYFYMQFLRYGRSEY